MRFWAKIRGFHYWLLSCFPILSFSFYLFSMHTLIHQIWESFIWGTLQWGRCWTMTMNFRCGDASSIPLHFKVMKMEFILLIKNQKRNLLFRVLSGLWYHECSIWLFFKIIRLEKLNDPGMILCKRWIFPQVPFRVLVSQRRVKLNGKFAYVGHI